MDHKYKLNSFPTYAFSTLEYNLTCWLALNILLESLGRCSSCGLSTGHRRALMCCRDLCPSLTATISNPVLYYLGCKPEKKGHHSWSKPEATRDDTRSLHWFIQFLGGR